MLTTAPTPAKHRGATASLGGSWCTWSRSFRTLVQDLELAGALSRRTRFATVSGCEPYDQTYAVALHSVPEELEARLRSCIRDFTKFRPKARIVLLRDMLFPRLNRHKTRVLFALIRNVMTSALGSEAACLYAPVNPKSDDEGFPLHADLFQTQRLFIVFDEVPTDGSGSSLFLARRDLLRNLAADAEKANRRHVGVRHLLTTPVKRDSFDRLYSLLHKQGARTKEWKDKAHRILFGSGEGYLLNDRYWLHGREPCSGRTC